VLPCQRVLTTGTVQTALDKVPGDGPVEVWVHPGTRSYGMSCFGGVCKRVTAVRVQAGCSASCQLLRRLVAAIGMYEPSLVRQIRILVPDEPANARLGAFAFNSCELLASVFLPPSVTSISSNAFYRCFRLTTLVIPDSVTCIRHRAFYQCLALRTVVIPESVTSIGDRAFCDCTSLASVTIPDSVTSIGGGAFRGCASLASVTIPSAITLDTDDIFFACHYRLAITRR
jgi:hypothetical protein